MSVWKNVGITDVHNSETFAKFFSLWKLVRFELTEKNTQNIFTTFWYQHKATPEKEKKRKHNSLYVFDRTMSPGKFHREILFPSTLKKCQRSSHETWYKYKVSSVNT